MNTLVGDREMEQAVELARRVSDLGADAILVQDLGLLSVLKKAVPDIPLHASTQMSLHNLAGVEAAAENVQRMEGRFDTQRRRGAFV